MQTPASLARAGVDAENIDSVINIFSVHKQSVRGKQGQK
jgi:hypothetical protein